MICGNMCRVARGQSRLITVLSRRCFSATNGRKSGRILTGATMNPHIKQIEYAVRGAIVIRAAEIEKEMKKGAEKPFEQVVKANIGDCHAVLGMKPLTFPRQVISVCVYPELLNDNTIPADVRARADRILNSAGGRSMGAYSDSAGIETIRKDVAQFIEERDGFPSDPDDIFLSSGASEAIRSMLKMVQTGENEGKGRAGVMIPTPQYPLYSASLSELNSVQIPYLLDEDNGWSLDINELRQSLDRARPNCVPRALCVINPGNPTGQVLSRENIQEIIQFCKEEGMILLADEVYQANIWGEGMKFHSFKQVLREMGPDYNDFELVSFHSTSKGFLGECGFRGGYMEVVGFDKEVKFHLKKMLSAKLCSCITGQVMMDCLVNPPKPGEESYETYMKERTAVLHSLKERAKLVADTFNSIEGIKCNEVMGAMYAFPRLFLPSGAVAAAKAQGMHPDSFYCQELLENTGLCVVPGNGFGQKDGTYHFRTTILPPIESLKPMFERFKKFHQEFMEKYSNDQTSEKRAGRI